MTQVAENRTPKRVPRARGRHLEEIENDARAALANRRDSDRPAVAERPQTERTPLTLAQRYALRDAIAYIVEAPEGEIGFVTAVRIAPFAYWPDELIVEGDPHGARFRVPIDTVSAVLPREGRLVVTTAPVDAQPIARPREASPTKARAWWLAAAAGAVFGLGGYVATFVALALDAGIVWGPGLAVSGAAGGVAAAASWRKRGSSWLAAIGLGSFWLPLAAGTILSLILVLR